MFGQDVQQCKLISLALSMRTGAFGDVEGCTFVNNTAGVNGGAVAFLGCVRRACVEFQQLDVVRHRV